MTAAQNTNTLIYNIMQVMAHDKWAIGIPASVNAPGFRVDARLQHLVEWSGSEVGLTRSTE